MLRRGELVMHGHGFNAHKASPQPMHTAAADGNSTDIERLVREEGHAVDAVNENGMTAMHLAAWHGHTEVIETLIRCGSKVVNATDNGAAMPIHLAASQGHAAVIETLAKYGCRAFELRGGGGRTPMMHAVAKHRGRCITVLTVLIGGSILLTSEQEALDIRYRAYFDQSLTSHLLLLLLNAF